MIQENERRRYASDLSDSQWAIIAPLFPRAGNRSKWEKRELANVVLYFVDNGCKRQNFPMIFLRTQRSPTFITPQSGAVFGRRSARHWWNGYGQTQRASSPSGKSCQNAGSLSALWLASTIPAVFPKIMKYLSALLRQFALLPPFALF